MSEMHVFCCERCGDIFEAETEQAFCKDGRKALAQPTARVTIYEHICTRCGKKYDSRKAQGKYCPDCRPIVCNQQKMEWAARNGKYDYEPAPKKRITKGNEGITDIVKKAAALGMSYGQYMSKYGG